jgi:hypothetical protein
MAVGMGLLLIPPHYDLLMGLGAWLGKLDGVVGRFNRWIAPAALATNAERSGASKGVPPDPVAIVAALGELERERSDEDEPRATS